MSASSFGESVIAILFCSDYWTGLLDEFEGSDLTQEAFCLSEGGNYHTFAKRRARCKRGELDQATARFQQLSIGSAPAQVPESLEVTLTCGNGAAWIECR